MPHGDNGWIGFDHAFSFDANHAVIIFEERRLGSFDELWRPDIEVPPAHREVSEHPGSLLLRREWNKGCDET